jgi:hypothetical protein
MMLQKQLFLLAAVFHNNRWLPPGAVGTQRPIIGEKSYLHQQC